MTPRHWRLAAIIVVMSWLVVISLFWQTALSMVDTWMRSDTFVHGFLVLPTSMYLIWIRRRRVASIVPISNWWGLLLLTLLGGGWLLSHLTDVLIVQQLALVGMLQGLVWTVLGSPIMRAVLFPLAFLFFAVPFGEDLIPPLQDFTAYFTVTALQLSGIPVLWEGLSLSVPSGTWHVNEACAGVRYIIPSVALGSVFAALTYRSWVRRLVFMVSSVAVPILANGLRAYGIVMIAHLTDNAIAVGVDHLVYGWLFFGVVMFLLFSIGLRWREPVSHESDEDGRVPVLGVRSSHSIEPGNGRMFSPKALGLTAASGVALLALAPLSVEALSNQQTGPVALHSVVPSVRAPWKLMSEYSGHWTPHFVGAEAEVLQSYTFDSQRMHVYVAYYASQRQGAELINSVNDIVDGKQWVRLAEGDTQAVVDDQEVRVHQTTMRSPSGTRLAWSWYWVAGESTASPYVAKLLQLKARLGGRKEGSAAIVLVTDYEYDPLDAAKVLQHFLSHMSLDVTPRSFSN